MISAALENQYTHPSVFQFIAVSVCVLTAVVIVLLRQIDISTSKLRCCSLFLATAISGGVGIWTAHFISILGYRPDLGLTYEARQTSISLLASVICVGAPLAYSNFCKTNAFKVLNGVGAGCGIWLMHQAGMLAVEGCLQQQSMFGNVAAVGLGCAFMGIATNLRGNKLGLITFVMLFVLSVVFTHSLSLSATTITPIEQSLSFGFDRANMLNLTAFGAIMLLLSVLIATYFTQRLDDRERRHASVLSTALQNMTNGLLYFGKDRKLKLYNREYLSLFSLPADALTLGMSRKDIVEVVGNVHGWDQKRRSLALTRANEWMTQPTEVPVEFTTDDGRVIKLEARSADLDGLVLTYNDVTGERIAEALANRLAFTDDLTGLPNRRQLRDRLEADYESKTEFSLILLDVDRFKIINDTYGHHVGDCLLVEIAVRLSSRLKDSFVARLASDEIVILAYGGTAVTQMAIDTVLELFNQGFLVGPSVSKVTCSIGICASSDAREPSDLMRFADIAHNEAKSGGRGRVCTFSDELRNKMDDLAAIESQMEYALHHGQFYLEYQPVVDARGFEIIGYEALIRWQHPSKGNISPNLFIPIAEESGLIEDIGAWVLMQACQDAVSLSPDTYIAVNVSPRQFRSGRLLGSILHALYVNDLPPSRLEIELTETAMVEDGALIASTLHALRNAGIKIAMDDFGTGYSSLAHLKDFPLDRIKIDRSFVKSAQTDTVSMAVLRGIVQIASDMRVSTLAEGVETEEQLAMVQSVGCGAIQGYYFGRPQPIFEHIGMLAEEVA